MTASSAKDPLFELGTITTTHGLRGDLKVRTDAIGTQVLLVADSVLLLCADGKQLSVDIAKASIHKHSILLRLRGYEHINSVAPFINAKVMLAYDKLPELEDGDYYWHQLEGLQVDDSKLGKIGRVSALLETAAHDIYVVEGDYGEVMIPAVEPFIDEIDITAGRIRVTLPAGLVDLNG